MSQAGSLPEAAREEGGCVGRRNKLSSTLARVQLDLHVLLVSTKRIEAPGTLGASRSGQFLTEASCSAPTILSMASTQELTSSLSSSLPPSLLCPQNHFILRLQPPPNNNPRPSVSLRPWLRRETNRTRLWIITSKHSSSILSTGKRSKVFAR